MSNPKFSVRLFQPEDQENWIALWNDYTENYEPTARGPLRGPAVLQSNWQAIIANTHKLHALALCDLSTGKPVGFAHYVFFHSTKSVHQECYLIDLFVSSEHRGKGGGRYLLEKLFERCRNEGLFRVTWITMKESEASQGLYEKIAKGSDWVRYVVLTE